MTPISLACSSQTPLMIEGMVTPESNLHVPLCIAVKRGDVDLIKVLLRLGADPNGKDGRPVASFISPTNKEEILNLLNAKIDPLPPPVSLEGKTTLKDLFNELPMIPQILRPKEIYPVEIV